MHSCTAYFLLLLLDVGQQRLPLADSNDRLSRSAWKLIDIAVLPVRERLPRNLRSAEARNQRDCRIVRVGAVRIYRFPSQFPIGMLNSSARSLKCVPLPTGFGKEPPSQFSRPTTPLPKSANTDDRRILATTQCPDAEALNVPGAQVESEASPSRSWRQRTTVGGGSFWVGVKTLICRITGGIRWNEVESYCS